MMNRIRLGLCVCVLALGVMFLWLAQEQIALAADMVQQSGGEFDSSSLLRLDPAFAFAGQNLFAPDDEQYLDSDQAGWTPSEILARTWIVPSSGCVIFGCGASLQDMA